MTSSPYELKHIGLDTLDIAFQGALPVAVVAELEAAKAVAAEAKHSVSVMLNGVAVEVFPSGRGGGKGGPGYAFTLRVGGRYGFHLWANRNSDPAQWNLFASGGSFWCADQGDLSTAAGALWSAWEALGATILDHSLNRVDVACDMRADDFVLYPDHFVCPAASTVEQYRAQDDDAFSAVYRGRRAETVTVGKMPGRQVCTYDKTAEIAKSGKPEWLARWGLARGVGRVWRVEVRLGKNELRAWNALKIGKAAPLLPDMIAHALRRARLVTDPDADTNISRCPTHPLWDAVAAAFSEHVGAGTGAARGRKVETYRGAWARQADAAILGYLATAAYVRGYRFCDVESAFDDFAAEARRALRERRDRLAETYADAAGRYSFLDQGEDDGGPGTRKPGAAGGGHQGGADHFSAFTIARLPWGAYGGGQGSPQSHCAA